MLLQAVVGAGLESPKDLCIRSLDLSIAAGMCHGHKAKLDVDVLAILLEESAFELGPVVRDDAAWDAKSAHNGLEECDC